MIYLILAYLMGVPIFVIICGVHDRGGRPEKQAGLLVVAIVWPAVGLCLVLEWIEGLLYKLYTKAQRKD